MPAESEGKVAKRAWVFLVLVASCGGDDAAECELPTGVWQVTYRETSGDCEAGSDLDQLVPFNGDRESLEGTPPSCVGSRVLSDDNCQWTISLRCDLRDASGTKVGSERTVSEINFVAPDRFEGIAERSFDFGDAGSCSGQFDVTGTPR